VTPLLAIGLPLLAALLTSLLPADRRGRWAGVGLAAEFLWLVASLANLGGLGGEAALTWSLAGRPLSLDPFTLGLLIIAVAVVLVVFAAATESGAEEAYAPGFLALAGTALAVATSDRLVTVAPPLLAGAAVIAITFGAAPGRAGPRAWRRFLVWLTLAGGALLLAGALDRLAERETGAGLSGTIGALFVIGVGITLAAFPLSLWLPGLSDVAPLGAALATGLLGVGATAALAGTLDVERWLLTEAAARPALTVAAGGAALLSGLLALADPRPARALAFLISANADLALAGVAATPAGDPTGAVWSLGAQALAAALALACLAGVDGKLRGLLGRRPAVALALIVALASLVGLPLTAGFVGRWLVGVAIVPVTPLLLLVSAGTSLLGGAAAWRALQPVVAAGDQTREPLRALDLAAAVLAALIVLAGLYPGPALALLR
jgi:formate hydrogenlyase subunit 3/multisubunit Na+/H+ antiporter MnhD subunit